MSALPSQIALTGNFHDPIQPTLGRFLSQDPIGFAGGPNLYGYTNNPLNYVDPDGLLELPTSAWDDPVIKYFNIGKQKVEVIVGRLKKGWKPDTALLKRADEEYKMMIARGAKPLSGPFDPSYNCFGQSFKDDLGKKIWIEELADLLKKRYDIARRGQVGDVLLFSKVDPKTQQLSPFHSMKVVEIKDGKKIYESKSVAGGLYHGTAEQVAKEYLDNPGLVRQWYHPKN